MEEFVYTGNGQRVPKDVVRVRLDPSVIKIEVEAFRNCTQLREVVFNEGLAKIQEWSFAFCYSLESITLPTTLTEIGDGAFNSCSSLSEVGLHEGLQTIGQNAFGDTSLQSISIPSTVKQVSSNAFYDCSNLQEVVVHEGLQTIGAEAFGYCSSLESITLPSSLTEIGRYAFVNCNSLREVVLHEGLQRIGQRAFEGCHLLERFTFPTISSRLNDVMEVVTEVNNRTRQLNEIDSIRGDMIARRGSELFVPGAVLRGDSSWNTIKASLDQIISWIRYHEIKEATTLLELALWKAKLDQEETHPINREAYRIEVPGPVKDTILRYFG